MKYLITIAIIAIAWFGFQWLSRMQSRQAPGRVEKPRAPLKWPSIFKRREEEPLPAQEMVPCGVCGAYVARGTTQGCGRVDCPQGG